MIRILVLLKKIANPIIIVRFAILDPNTLPTDNPPSSAKEAKAETESSGKEVVTDNRTKPAAISDKPKTLDKINVYLMILSLTTPIRNKDIINKGKLYKFILKHL
ncbi:MAG: hypothetical protein NWF11_02100 [Candidatus Bathyarchaeota archaeon]|nr:hypothetical protein [Candidatus Bathyarchaeota archaeon]